MFKNKVLMITGGTGSFGNAVLKHFLNSDLKRNPDFLAVMRRNRKICVSNIKMIGEFLSLVMSGTLIRSIMPC